MTSIGFTTAEVLPSPPDEEPEHEGDFTDKGELPDADRGTRDKHCDEPVCHVSEPRYDKQDAEDFRHEAGLISQVANRGSDLLLMLNLLTDA